MGYKQQPCDCRAQVSSPKIPLRVQGVQELIASYFSTNTPPNKFPVVLHVHTRGHETLKSGVRSI